MTKSSEIKDIQQEYKWIYPIIFGVILILTGIILGAFLFGSQTPPITGNMLSYVTNLWTEAISIGITVFILDRIYSFRNTNSQREFLLKRLIREMGSYDNSTAIRAIEAITDEGWLIDGTLSQRRWDEPNLSGANLRHAMFKNSKLIAASLQRVIAYHANLENARLDSSDLRYARFNVANCKNASFYYTDMRHSDFRMVNFENALLAESDLQNANLTGVNFKGADLHNINLENANLEDAIFNEKTILPDGRYWSEDVDLDRFTKHRHPKFWRPTDESWLEYDDDAPPPWWLRDRKRPSRDY